MSKSSECSRCECSFTKPICECPHEQNVKHDEAETLKAMEKFRKFYEDKLKQIDIEGGGDCTELKLKLQERWIKDLTEQTEMMAKIVSELEEEATTRVRMLEDKLKQSSKAAYEEDSPSPDNGKLLSYEELLKKKNEEYESLKQTMLDMRSALTEEVACKHDMILALKKDVLQLEERCVQADKQTAFKDDIIKELRKEIKQLKQQLTHNIPLKQLKIGGSKTVLTTEKSLNKSRKSDEYYLHNILNRLQNLKKKIQNSYNQRKLISKKMKALEQDNGEKNKLLMNLFNVIRALLCKLHTMGNNSNEIQEKDISQLTEEELGIGVTKILELKFEHSVLLVLMKKI